MSDTSILPGPTSTWTQSIPIQYFIVPSDSISIEIAFRPLDGMLFDDFKACIDAARDVVKIVLEEVQSLAPVSDYVAPTVELTRIHYGSPFDIKIIIKNVKVQHYALTVMLLLGAFGTVVGLGKVGAQVYETHTKAQIEQLKEDHKHTIERDTLKERAREFDIQAELGRQNMEHTFAVKTGSHPPSSKPKDITKRLMPSCKTLAGAPTEGASQEKPIVQDVKVGGIPAVPPQP